MQVRKYSFHTPLKGDFSSSSLSILQPYLVGDPAGQRSGNPLTQSIHASQLAGVSLCGTKLMRMM